MTSLAIRTVPRSLPLAISRAGAALIELQREDGSWSTDTDIGPVGMATQILTEQLFGATSPADEVRAYVPEATTARRIVPRPSQREEGERHRHRALLGRASERWSLSC